MDRGHGQGWRSRLRALLRRLLPATDFSPQPNAAEMAAARLAPHAGAVDLIQVVDPDVAARHARWPAMARAALDDIAREIAAAGGACEIHLATREPSAAIARAAVERDADLIVVGKHGQGWVDSIASGFTAVGLR